MKTWIRWLVIALALAAAPSEAVDKKPAVASKKRRKAKPQGATATQISAVLDAQGDKVRKCVTEEVLDKGGTAVNVTVHIDITNTGQVLGCNVTTTAPREQDVKLSKCVDTALRDVQFPRSTTSMIQINRTWKYSMQ